MTEQESARKVALIGTSCVGKTSIIEHFRNSGEEVKLAIVDEAATIFFTQNPDITDRFSEEAQGKVQELALKLEGDARVSGAKAILCERSVLDAVAYVWSQGDRQGAERLFERVAFWLPTYDKFLLLDPKGVPYKKQGTRQEDEEQRNQFHQGFLELFEEKQIPYELLNGSLEERVKRVDEILTEDE